MRALVRSVIRAAILACSLAFTLMLPIAAPTAVLAADGDACVIGGLPGTLSSGDTVCTPVPTPAVGQSCGPGGFYNGAMCVADGATCGDGLGTYSAGICQPTTPGDPPTEPTAPASPVGFTPNPEAGTGPYGVQQQPMCVNASPFIGGGMFVVSGTVLCYTGAGKMTEIYAYTDPAGASGSDGGWNPFDPSAWNSLSMKDLFASDDVTALGTITAYGGAQLYSLNGRNGVQVDDAGVLLGASDVDGNITTAFVEATGVSLSSTDGTSTSSLTVSGGSGIELVAAVATGGPAVEISGSIGATSTARIGVVLTGDGQGAESAPTDGGPANWADVLVASRSFSLDGNTGSGVIVNDHGVTIRSANIGASYNEFGSGAGRLAGSSIVNVIGDGGAGSVANFIGRAGAPGTTVINEMGTAGGGGATINRIGNANASSSVLATGGTSSMVIVQGALDLVTVGGTSVLAGATQDVVGGNALGMHGIDTRHAVIDPNGRVGIVDGPVTGSSSSAMYIANGRGSVNGFVANEETAVMSGGVDSPTSLALSDTGAHFSNTSTGAPVVVSGVANGVGPFDAANMRQLDSGLASVAALAGLPAPQPGKHNAVGVAVGYHGDSMAMAIGGQSMLEGDMTFKYGAALSYSHGYVNTSASMGVGVSW